jgi:hypothetical protein
MEKPYTFVIGNGAYSNGVKSPRRFLDAFRRFSIRPQQTEKTLSNTALNLRS